MHTHTQFSLLWTTTSANFLNSLNWLVDQKKRRLVIVYKSSPFKKKCQTRFCFQLLKCEDSLSFIIIYDSQWRVFGFWTVGWTEDANWRCRLTGPLWHIKGRLFCGQTFSDSHSERTVKFSWIYWLILETIIANCNPDLNWERSALYLLKKQQRKRQVESAEGFDFVSL